MWTKERDLWRSFLEYFCMDPDTAKKALEYLASFFSFFVGKAPFTRGNFILLNDCQKRKELGLLHFSGRIIWVTAASLCTLFVILPLPRYAKSLTFIYIIPSPYMLLVAIPLGS
jgi:hypothetical protein